MRGFWDVLWSDVTAFAMFAGPLVLLSVPAAAVGAALGAIGQRLESWRRLLRAMVRGAVVGSVAAVVLGMLFEYGLSLEGFSGSRRSVRSYTIAPLWGVAIAVALGAAFLAIRRNMPSLFGSAPIRRRFTLLQLFATQLVIGLALGWWVFTRRTEIGYRSGEINWRAQVAADKALFEPYGWQVDTWENYDQYRLRTISDWMALYPQGPRPFRQQPISDEVLDLVAAHTRLHRICIVSDGITDAGLARLATSKSLQDVWIKSNQITDDGVAKLCELRGLRGVGIHSEQVTKVALQHLAEMKSVWMVTLDSPLITPQDEADFRAARPDVDLRINSTQW